MGFSMVLSAALQGLEVQLVQVEADLSNGLPMFHMVGYLSAEVREAGERVRTAIQNSGIQLQPKKTVINLSPGNVRKKGASFDLPIALAILDALGYVDSKMLQRTIVTGELSLDGKIRKVSGVLPIVAEAKKQGICRCILPRENWAEGALVEGIEIIAADNLQQLCGYLSHRESAINIQDTGCEIYAENVEEDKKDFGDIKGQEIVKRAAEVAVAGGHNLLLIGPPGSGKSMIAQRIPTILPPMSREESMEITKIYSVMGLLKEKEPLLTGRPFREIHHTATKAALAGGGNTPRPGEVSLANKGVLFLDELTEFQKPVLEVLRQPLEQRSVHIVRSQGTYVFPADFMLVAAMNPCPCGYYPDYEKCICTPTQIRQYLGKISQPFLDRIDVCVESPRVEYEALRGIKAEESSEAIRTRICNAREIQRTRYKELKVLSNAALSASETQRYCVLGAEEERIMKQAFEALGLTGRSYHKILKVARTIADLSGEEIIRKEHLREAIGYRTADKNYWGRA